MTLFLRPHSASWSASQRTRTLLAISHRNNEVGAQYPLRFVIGDLPRASTRRLTLAPLTESAVARLAGDCGRGSKELQAITGGNPFFVTEVLAAPGDTVPATVRDAVLARTLRLPAAVRELAEFACVLPGKAEGWLLEKAALTDEVAMEGCLRIGTQRHDDGAPRLSRRWGRRCRGAEPRAAGRWPGRVGQLTP